jgi:hypothetical protein
MTSRAASTTLVPLVVAFNLLLAALQLLFLVPVVSGGRSLDLYLFRADALNLAFGASVALALGIGAAILASLRPRQAACLILFSLSALALAYARDPLAFILAWELAGLALWLPLLDMPHRAGIPLVAVYIHLPGLLLLLAILFGPTPPFSPPQGGEAAPWPLYLSLTFGLVSLFRAACWLFFPRTPTLSAIHPTLPFYILLSPLLLAKALVAAPWDSLAIWLLALIASASLLAALLAFLWGANHTISLAAALASATIVGFALAPLSPLTAAGALALLLAGTIWIATSSLQPCPAFLLMASSVPAVWLLTEGALDARYRLVAAILLPILFLLACLAAPGPVDGVPARTSRLLSLIASLLIIPAVYPQAAVDWVLRPAVGAMAGGVGVPSSLVIDHAIGLLIRSPQETIVASLPVTGIALALFLAWAALYWLRALSRLISGRSHPLPNAQSTNDA